MNVYMFLPIIKNIKNSYLARLTFYTFPIDVVHVLDGFDQFL